MKKAALAIFSISITAGTLYLGYSKLKSHMINKLVKSWDEGGKKLGKPITKEQGEELIKELDKLYAWEVKTLADYSALALKRAPATQIEPAAKKLKDKQIVEKLDLKAVDVLLFGT